MRNEPNTMKRKQRVVIRHPHKKTTLDDLDMAVIEERMKNPTITGKALAKKFNVNYTTLYSRYKNPEFQTKLASVRERAVDIILDARMKAANKLVKHINNRNGFVSSNVCLKLVADILPSSKVDIKHSGEINLTSSLPRPAISSTRVAVDGEVVEAQLITPGANGNGTNGNGKEH